jgi:hypothetical protein
LIVDFYQRETPVKMGSKRTCGGAAAGSQRFRTSSQTLDDGSQPEADMTCASVALELPNKWAGKSELAAFAM